MVRKVVVKRLLEPSDEKFQLWMDQVAVIDDIAEKNGLYKIKRDWDPESYIVRVECSAPQASDIVNCIMQINAHLNSVGLEEECVMTDDIHHPRQDKAREALNWLESQDCAVS